MKSVERTLPMAELQRSRFLRAPMTLYTKKSALKRLRSFKSASKIGRATRLIILEIYSCMEITLS